MYEIKTLKLGRMENFVYLIKDAATRRITVIDPAWDVPAILQAVEEMDGRLTDILITHAHYDHVNGVDEVMHCTDATLHINVIEDDFWGGAGRNARRHRGGDDLQLGNTDIRMHHIPGHTPGSVCYQLDGQLFTGDTVFVWGCGRCDFRGGNPEQLFHSLKRIGSYFPASTIIMPGHDYASTPTSTVGEQVEGNPFFLIDNVDQFVDYRMNKHNRTTPYRPNEF